MRNERHDHIREGNDMSQMPSWAQEAIKFDEVDLEYVLAQWVNDGRVWIAVKIGDAAAAFPLDDTDIDRLHGMIAVYLQQKISRQN